MKKFVLLGNFVLLGLLTFLPKAEAAFTISCSAVAGSGIKGILEWAGCILSEAIVPIIVTLAMIGFIWGVIQYYLNPENEEKRKKGKNFIVGGLLALFVIVAMWGIVGILVTTFGTNTASNVVHVPQLPTQ
jgi:hypothetical protein